MTLHEAIAALLDEFHLEDFTEVYQDEAKQDRTHSGYSWQHPRVRRFKQVCDTLRQAKRNGGSDGERHDSATH